MKKCFLIFTMIFMMTTFSFGQKVDDVLEEGKLLYRLEKASWYGTDVFLEMFSQNMDNVGGYLTYLNKNNKIINIFYEKDNPSNIIVRFEFDALPQKSPTKIDTQNQAATTQEMELIVIRQDAIKIINQNEGGFFTFYNNTSFNIIPIIANGKKKVFILTATAASDVVIIGNDYLLTYNNKNKLTKKEKIHNSLLQYPYKSEGSGNTTTSTFHSHVLSDLITSTDICTLLLYKDFIEWKQHYVLSKKYMSIFDLEKESLAVMTKKEWDKINENQKKNTN